ncbi:ATP-binding cassette domain-containing protein [Mucilaginibacter sp. McL0603]|uniref:ATP-binding cassette domain-containing protein n=1 Tax=Mucilaginibacter sp. McL0603 TaxID=3415670 RepID=UPI003CF67FAD
MISVDIEKKLKAYKGQQMLKISAQFQSGSITKIFGPSGAGKTTFLKIIAGLIDPEKGEIKVDDNTWLDTSAKIFLSPQKRRVGFVFQNYALFPNMTVRQHMEYATEDNKWIDRLLAIGKLETFAKHKPEYLSGGQQQRLSILRAMAIKPQLLLMDEPFSALDPKMKSELIPELKTLWKELGATTLIVTHNPHELEGLTDAEMEIDPT